MNKKRIKSKYPIFIISKGRWEKRLTVKAFDKINIDYKIVVEPAEYEKYAEVIDDKMIIIAPENFSEKGQGSIPIRNFVFDYAKKKGYEKHWIWDDNIASIMRNDKNSRIKCNTATPLLICEEFTDRFQNIALSGMNYDFFLIQKDKPPPFRFNTRIYSNILINHKIPFKWRGRYNEDTDLSLRCLKAGWNTILFNAFLVEKSTTLTEKGGNTDTIYNRGDKRRLFAESLKKQHPDCVKITWKYNRWHHQVDYRKFKNRKLEYKKDYKPLGNKINNYGMKLVKRVS